MAYILGAFVVFVMMTGAVALAAPVWVAWAVALLLGLVSVVSASGVGRRLGGAWIVEGAGEG